MARNPKYMSTFSYKCRYNKMGLNMIAAFPIIVYICFDQGIFFKEKISSSDLVYNNELDRLSTENLNRFGNGLFISTFHSWIRLSTLFNMSCKIQKLMACEKVLIITLCATITAILIDPIASFYIILIKKKYILKYFILSRILNQIIAYLWWCFGVA